MPKDYIFDPKRNPLLRKDYRPDSYRITDVNLRITLDEEQTTVHSRIWVSANPEATQQSGRGPLILDGEKIKLKKLQVVENGALRHLDQSEFLVTEKNLIIKTPPTQPFALEIETEINPQENTALSGIYMAGDVLCSQCEAQGFRRITYFLDRPDNLAKFTVTLAADKKKFPVLLSNGNGDFKNAKDLGNGLHTITWSDPWPKPSYLFAVVAGDLKVVEDTFVTMSGKKVDLRIFVEAGYEDKVGWAMESIKRSMKWDEDKYGREYDLDCFHVVAVSKFNAGAMENKGLNIFNISYLVGNPETSTDNDLIEIESIIAHEYFHNWTGNRVTLRDWFELTLKEGLTVLRDRQFTADMHSAAIKTIEDAMELRAGQYMEDSGPTSHPIRPDIVEEFDNIYTGTIYTKGSHVLGMLKTILGDSLWRLAMDQYFQKFDGKAVTCDDFIDNMEEVSGIDLSQFRLWYSQSGTPEIEYTGVYDAAAKTYALTLTQKTPATADQPAHLKKPLHIPIAVGLISASGKDIFPTTTLHLKDEKKTFVFENIPGPVVPSILRGFSAPVKIMTQPSDEELSFRMAHDSDPFNRYEASERLMIKVLHHLIASAEKGQKLEVPESFMESYGILVASAEDGDLSFNARALDLPPRNLVVQDLGAINPLALSAAMKHLHQAIAQRFEHVFHDLYTKTTPDASPYAVSPEQRGRRQLHNLSLAYLNKLKKPEADDMALAQYQSADNMTEKFAALVQLCHNRSAYAERASEDFYQRYKDNANLVAKWIWVQAGIPAKDPSAHLQNLMLHPAFDLKTPNHVYMLLGGFTDANIAAYHKADGSGYRFVADLVIDLNALNPQVAANAVKKLAQFKRVDLKRQELMIAELKRIAETPNLEKNVSEIVGQALATAKPPSTSSAPKLA